MNLLETKAETIVDEAAGDDATIPEQYDIASFGADYDVEGIVRRLQRGDIFNPKFQRDYVWTQVEASRFIESLLLGLPVPGIFLARDTGSNKLIVIDGQQRISTLRFFYEGFFNPKSDDKNRRIFKLLGVQKKFLNKAFKDLPDNDIVKLNDSIIHATIVRQESPNDNDTSVYHIFERLNNGGRKLDAQEIRTAIYHGDMIDLVGELNNNSYWRQIFGKKHTHLKDQELILRYFALHFGSAVYERPMKEFLNVFAKKNISMSDEFKQECRELFDNMILVAYKNFGVKAFKPQRSINAAVFDAVAVGLTKRLQNDVPVDEDKLRAAYDALLQDADFIRASSQSTADEANVKDRLKKATEKFENI